MHNHICPWYLGYFLINPFRKFFQNPETILRPYIKQGMRVLEIGPGMGFFTLPIARLVGENGRVFAVDIQEKMLKNLKHRSIKANLIERIEIRQCVESSLRIDDLTASIDFTLTFSVVHEVPDQKYLFEQIGKVLKKGGLLLISEPKGHVTEKEFDKTLSIAMSNGMKKVDSAAIKQNLSAVFMKI